MIIELNFIGGKFIKVVVLWSLSLNKINVDCCHLWLLNLNSNCYHLLFVLSLNNIQIIIYFPGLTTGSSPIFNIASATPAPARKTAADEFLNSDNDKNDYDWYTSEIFRLML